MDSFDRMPNREDYLSAPPSHAPKVRSAKPMVTQAQIRNEERFGSLLAAAGIIWGVYLVTTNLSTGFSFDVLTPGPLATAALGILLWLHAKWRRSVNRA